MSLEITKVWFDEMSGEIKKEKIPEKEIWIGLSATDLAEIPPSCPLNVASCCYGCHQYLDSRPYEKAAWFEQFLGVDVAQVIREKSENTQHGLKKCLKEITKHYKAEHARIVQANRDGVPKVTVVGFL